MRKSTGADPCPAVHSRTTCAQNGFEKSRLPRCGYRASNAGQMDLLAQPCRLPPSASFGCGLHDLYDIRKESRHYLVPRAVRPEAGEQFRRPGRIQRGSPRCKATTDDLSQPDNLILALNPSHVSDQRRDHVLEASSKRPGADDRMRARIRDRGVVAPSIRPWLTAFTQASSRHGTTSKFRLNPV
jgi:hypothetical protein